jgi:hypothetical protein
VVPASQTPATVTAAQAIASFKASRTIPRQTIADSSANVASLLDQLLPLAVAGDIASIALTDTQPLHVTGASYLADAQVLAMLGTGYALIVSGVLAVNAQAAQMAGHVTSFAVADSTGAVASNLDALNAATRLTAITLTNGNVLTVTIGQFTADTVALSKLPPNYLLTVTGVTAQGAVTVQNAVHTGAFSVIDSAANVIANLAALNADGKLSSITLTDTTTLTIAYAQFTADGAALAKLTANVLLIVTGVTASGAATVQVDTQVKLFSVIDSAAAVMANFATLNISSKLTSIALAGTTPLAITEAQFASGTSFLSKLASNVTLAISGVSAAGALAAQANVKVVSFSVSDTAANVVANLGALNASTKLQTITLTDTAPLSISLSQLSAYAMVLAKLPAGFGVAVSGVTAAGAGAVQANVHVKSFSVTDSSTNVVAFLDALHGYTRLTSITLTDSRQLSLTFAQYTNDATTLARIGGNWLAIVINVAAALAPGVQADPHVASFSVSDTAGAVASTIDALNGDTKLTGITITPSGTMILTVHQLASDTIALGKIVSLYQVIVTGATVSNFASAQSNTHVTAIQVTDTAANILAGLAALNSALLVTSITLSAGTTLAVSYAQFATYSSVLGRLSIQDLLTVGGVTAANAQTVQANARVSSFAVSDTAANIVANLDALNADGKLSSIAVTGTSALTLGYTTFLADSTALGKLTGAYTLTVTGAAAAGASLVAANTHVTHFTVSDTLGDVGARLDQLQAAAVAGKLTSIAVTNAGASITISSAQYSADSGAIALMTGSFTVNHAAAATGATINLIWDAQALAAPAAFRSALTDAAQYIGSLITNPITINISVGYGEIQGSPLGNGVLGAGGPDQGIGQTYAQYRSDLATHITSATTQTIVNNLPVADPSRGGTIYVASAEEKALGLLSGTATGLDGSVGFAADPGGTLFTYDPNNRAVAGKYDLIGTAEHELTHALGRIAMGGTYGNWISALDVFRYASPGVHSPNAGGAAYYSIDGGTTNLDWFSGTSDLGDWSTGSGNDANNAYSNPGVVNLFTPADITELDALGFATAGTPSASTAGQTTVSASTGLNAPSLTFLGLPVVAFMSDDLPTIAATLNPVGGIEEIALFAYGVNELTIDLQGAANAAFVAFDTTVNGQHAIALANRADTAHGLVLTNMPANDTAADLMANHLTFSGGHAMIA